MRLRAVLSKTRVNSWHDSCKVIQEAAEHTQAFVTKMADMFTCLVAKQMINMLTLASDMTPYLTNGLIFPQ